MSTPQRDAGGVGAPDVLLRQLEETRQRVAALHRGSASPDPGAADRLVQALLRDLEAVLDRLLVSEETLRAQNEALAESREMIRLERERYRSLFEMAPDPYLVTESDATVREANRAAGALFGLDPGGMAGVSLEPHVAPGDRARFRELLDTVRERGRSDGFRLHLQPRGAAPVPVSASVVMQPAREGRLLWLIRDVSVQRAAEQSALRLVEEQAARAEAETTRERISNILESISDGFVALDPEARITYMNRRAEQLLARPREQLLGRIAWECFPELIGTAFEREYLHARNSGEAVCLEEFYEPAGTWIELNAFPTADGLTVYFRNITRRKRAEEVQRFLGCLSDELSGSIDLQETLQRVAQLAVPQMGDMCVVYLVEARGKIRRAAASHASPAKQQLLDELLRAAPIRPDGSESPVVRVLRSGEAEMITELTERTLETYATDADHLRTLRALAPRSMISVPLISRGRTLGAISVACSETSRAYTEKDLALAWEVARRAALALDNARLYADAREASRARQEILHLVSHDLRNSLNALLLNLDVLLAETEDNERDEPARPEVEGIQRSASQMERLLQDLLDVESVESGRFTVHPGIVRADAAIAEAVVLLQPMAAERSLALRSDVEPGLSLLRADPARLQQVLVNLIGNAIKFTAPGGEVVVTAERHAGDAAMVRLAVRDTGEGIRAEDLPLVFDRYWQSERSRRSGKGTGLGLAISRGIVEAHGGRIWAESAAGEGSTFSFTLPTVP